MLAKNFIPHKPFPDFKWQWACFQPTEGLNDPVILLGLLSRMRKLEPLGVKYSSDEFARELIDLSNDTQDSVGVDLARRTGDRNLLFKLSAKFGLPKLCRSLKGSVFSFHAPHGPIKLLLGVRC